MSFLSPTNNRYETSANNNETSTISFTYTVIISSADTTTITDIITVPMFTTNAITLTTDKGVAATGIDTGVVIHDETITFII